MRRGRGAVRVVRPPAARTLAELPDVFGAVELAGVLGVNVKVVWRETAAGNIPCLPLGGRRRRYARWRIEQWLRDGGACGAAAAVPA